MLMYHNRPPDSCAEGLKAPNMIYAGVGPVSTIAMAVV